MTRTYADGIEDAARALKAWEDWEAAVILDPSAWSDQYGFTVEGDNYDRYIELQDLRNAAIRTLSTSPSGIDDAREALTGWQPIETAPREGTGLLLIDMGAVEPEAGFGAYVFDFWTAIVHEGLEDDKEFLSSVIWVSPTHWMPLPAPPLCESASSKIGGDHG